jgi:hypothetical protein
MQICSSLWFSVLLLVFAHGEDGDFLTALSGIANVDQSESEHDNTRQSQSEGNAKRSVDEASEEIAPLDPATGGGLVAQPSDQQTPSEGVAKRSVDKVSEEGTPLELTTEDGLTVVSPKTTTAPIESIPNGDTDGAMGLLRQRLASEEQFNQRLQQLLAKSALDTKNKQGQVIVLQEQLAVAMQSQQNVNSAFMKKIAAENQALTEERSHTQEIENKLRKAGHIIDTEHQTITLLRERMGTILSHLRNVTHIGKVMENQLADAKAMENIKSHQLVAVQREAALQQRAPREFEAKLHEIQASKASDDMRLKAIEHQNSLLRQRIVSMSQRDKIYQNENTILRKQLRGKNREEQEEAEELEKVKGALAEAQKTNFNLQGKYADSLKALLNAREGSVAADLAGASTPSLDDTDPIKDASLLMQLKHDSKRLRSMMSLKPKRVPDGLRAGSARVQTVRDISQSSKSELALSHDSQGLTALLDRMSNATELKASKQNWH